MAVVRDGRTVLEADLDALRAAWRAVDVLGYPDPTTLAAWDEVHRVGAVGDGARLVVWSAADAVLARLRDAGGVVTDVRPLGLREVYLELTAGADRQAA